MTWNPRKEGRLGRENLSEMTALNGMGESADLRNTGSKWTRRRKELSSS